MDGVTGGSQRARLEVASARISYRISVILGDFSATA
jgi:hypothetical protein